MVDQKSRKKKFSFTKIFSDYAEHQISEFNMDTISTERHSGGESPGYRPGTPTEELRDNTGYGDQLGDSPTGLEPPRLQRVASGALSNFTPDTFSGILSILDENDNEDVEEYLWGPSTPRDSPWDAYSESDILHQGRDTDTRTVDTWRDEEDWDEIRTSPRSIDRHTPGPQRHLDIGQISEPVPYIRENTRTVQEATGFTPKELEDNSLLVLGQDGQWQDPPRTPIDQEPGMDGSGQYC